MNRPTKRPTLPLSYEGVRTQLFQHFVTDGGGRCISEFGGCSYQGNESLGCFVGILLTEEDARKLDPMGPISSVIHDPAGNEIIREYFQMCNCLLAFLCLGQIAHDSWSAGPATFTEHMANFFKRWDASCLAVSV